MPRSSTSPRRLTRSEQQQLYAETVTWYRRYGVSDRVVPPTLEDFWARFEHICAHVLELTPAVSWVLDPSTNPKPSQAPGLPGPFSIFDGLVAQLGADVLRLLVFGSMPDIVRRRFEFSWSNLDRLRYVGVCASLQMSEPAVHRGALSALWPEGTPHLHPADRSRVIVAGPNPRQAQQGSDLH